MIGDPKAFRSAASLQPGRVDIQKPGSGDKENPHGISEQQARNTYLPTLLFHAARSLLVHAKVSGSLTNGMKKHRPPNLVAVE